MQNDVTIGLLHIAQPFTIDGHVLIPHKKNHAHQRGYVDWINDRAPRHETLAMTKTTLLFGHRF